MVLSLYRFGNLYGIIWKVRICLVILALELSASTDISCCGKGTSAIAESAGIASDMSQIYAIDIIDAIWVACDRNRTRWDNIERSISITIRVESGGIFGDERADTVVEFQGAETVVHLVVAVACHSHVSLLVAHDFNLTRCSEIEGVRPTIVRFGVLVKFPVL